MARSRAAAPAATTLAVRRVADRRFPTGAVVHTGVPVQRHAAGWSFPVFAILIPALFHFQVNGQVWPDAQPRETVVYAFVAVIVVFLNRKDMFTKGAGATEVLMASDAPTLAR